MGRKQALAVVEPNRAELIPTALSDLEEVIQSGLHTFIEVGNALAGVARLIKLGQADGYSSFGQYCRDRWGFTRAYGYYQIAAAKAASNVSTIVDTASLTESLIRPIVNLTLDQQTKVFLKALESAADGKLIAKHIAECASQYKKTTDRSTKPEFDPLTARRKLSQYILKYATTWPYKRRMELVRILKECADSIENFKPEAMA